MAFHFTKRDFRDFISDHGVSPIGNTTGIIFDPKINKQREMKDEDFLEPTDITLQILDVYDDFSWTVVHVSNCAFVAYDYTATGHRKIYKDLSKEWCETLVEKYGEEYSNSTIELLDEDIDKADKLLNNPATTPEQKTKFSRFKNYFEKFKNIIKHKQHQEDLNKEDNAKL